MTSAPAIPDLLSAENLANPWPGYQILRDHYPVFWHEPSQSWVISRYEHIKPLVKDPRVTHEYLQDILGVFLGDAPVMVAMEGRQHASRRKLVGPFLNGKGLDAFAATIERQARETLGDQHPPCRDRRNGEIFSNFPARSLVSARCGSSACAASA